MKNDSLNCEHNVQRTFNTLSELREFITAQEAEGYKVTKSRDVTPFG